MFYLLRHRHTSPFEQVEFKFRVRAPVVTWWQWVRHRTLNMNAQCGRYVAFEENDFYVPDVWRKQSPSNKQASLGEVTPEEGAELTEALVEHYEQGYALYEAGNGQRRGARTCARLPARLLGVLHLGDQSRRPQHDALSQLRMAEEAQHEIRVYAQAIYEHFFKPLLPWTAEAFEKFILGSTAHSPNAPPDPIDLSA